MSRRRRWRGALAALAAAVALTPVALVLIDQLRGWHSDWTAGRSVAAVSVCLFGASPDEVGNAERRLRRVSIAASLDARHGSWPGRCGSYVTRAQRSLVRLKARLSERCVDGRCCAPECGQLDQLSQELSRGAQLARRGSSPAFDPDRMLALARALDLTGRAPSDVPPAPPPSRLLDPERMQPLYRGDYLRLLTDPAGDETLDLLFYEHETRYGLCSVDLGAAGAARCGALADTIPVGLAGELLAAERGAPPRMYAQGPAGQRWQQALYDVRSGRMLTAVSQRPSGGFVWRDGSFARLGLEPPMADLALYRVRAGVPEAPVSLGLPAEPSLGPRLAWDEIIWTEQDGARHRVFARRLLPGDTPLGPAREIGVTPPLVGKPDINICRTDEALALLVGGRTQSRNKAVATLMLRTEGSWRQAHQMRIGSPSGFTCWRDTATLSWIRTLVEEPLPGYHSDTTVFAEQQGDAAPVRGRYEVHRLRCAPQACELQRAVVSLERYAHDSRYVAGDAGEASVVLWRSPVGDVRMRVAPLDELPRADDVPLFDDIENDGFGWDLERDPIFGRAGAVVVLVSRQLDTSEASMTYAFRIDAAGKVSPVGVAGADAGRLDAPL